MQLPAPPPPRPHQRVACGLAALAAAAIAAPLSHSEAWRPNENQWVVTTHHVYLSAPLFEITTTYHFLPQEVRLVVSAAPLPALQSSVRSLPRVGLSWTLAGEYDQVSPPVAGHAAPPDPGGVVWGGGGGRFMCTSEAQVRDVPLDVGQ